jgi:hypothetical protein
VMVVTDDALTESQVGLRIYNADLRIVK